MHPCRLLFTDEGVLEGKFRKALRRKFIFVYMYEMKKIL